MENIDKLGDSEQMSIDRIDSLKGYTEDNIVLCCWQVNSMKGPMTTEELKEWCKLILNNDLL